MNWRLYQLRFRLLSPLHLGRGSVGNIQFTRPYVTTRQMWGAVTARLTRSALYGEWTPPPGISAGDYVTIGNLVKEELAFTYFYPEDDCGRPLYPCITDNGLRYGTRDFELTEDDFCWRHLNSYASTALDYNLNSAEDGTLHEVEYLSAQTREDRVPVSNGLALQNTKSYPVFLTGYVFEKSGCVLPWQTIFRCLRLGGELKSGWGRLQLRPIQAPLSGSTRIFDILQCDLDSTRPRLKAVKDQPLLSHTLVDTNALPSFKVRGDIEPLVGREWSQGKGAGQQINLAGVCYVPGSIISSDGEYLLEMTTEHVLRPILDS